jgi:hypothetical protein
MRVRKSGAATISPRAFSLVATTIDVALYSHVCEGHFDKFDRTFHQASHSYAR